MEHHLLGYGDKGTSSHPDTSNSSIKGEKLEFCTFNAYGPRDGNLRSCSCSRTGTRYVCIYKWSMLTFLNLLFRKKTFSKSGNGRAHWLFLAIQSYKHVSLNLGFSPSILECKSVSCCMYLLRCWLYAVLYRNPSTSGSNPVTYLPVFTFHV